MNRLNKHDAMGTGLLRALAMTGDESFLLGFPGALCTVRKLLLAIAAALAVAALAVAALGGAALAAGSAAGSPRYIDEVNLLTAQEAGELTAKLDAISERHQFDVVVAVVDSLGGKNARLYAADFYEQKGFGFGRNLDGIILLVAMEYREYAFVTTGYGMRAFTDAGQVYLEKLFLPYLKSDEYSMAFMAFADAVDDFLVKAGEGEPYDTGNIRLTPSEKMKYRLYTAIGSVLLGLIIALVVTGIWRSQLKSVGRQDLAQAYIRPGSMALTARRDIFLHRHVTKTARPKNTSSGGGSFKSSSGRSFSGRSGRF